jgi:FkbM family methyltransferase
MAKLVTTLLKGLRASQPFNSVATSSVRIVLSCLGVRSEFIIKHLHRFGSVRSTLPNGRILQLWSKGDDWVSNQVFWRSWRGYEPETIPLFYQCATRARVTLDVGAYVGFYSLLAAHANPAGKVFAFEPLPSIHERLQQNVARNGLMNVECLETAVGERDGTADFFHMDLTLPTSSSMSEEFMRTASGVRRSAIPVITLDRFIRERNLTGVDLVKIDTESTEPQVLRGMLETLRRDRPTLFCEVLKGRGSERALEEVLAPLGYRYYLLTPEGPMPQERIEGHPTWLNYLFAIPGAALLPLP